MKDNSNVAIPLHEGHPPIVDLNAPMDFTPSKPFQTVGPFVSPLGAPNIFLGSFWSFQTIPPCPNPRVLSPFDCLDGTAKFFHSLTKWPKEYDRILASYIRTVLEKFIFVFPSISCISFLFTHHVQVNNPKNKINLVLANILGNLPIPLARMACA